MPDYTVRSSDMTSDPTMTNCISTIHLFYHYQHAQNHSDQRFTSTLNANLRNIATAKPVIANVAHLFILLVFNILNPPWIIGFAVIRKQYIDLDP